MGFSKHICLQIFTDFPVFLSIKYDGAIPVLNFIKCSLKTIFFFFKKVFFCASFYLLYTPLPSTYGDNTPLQGFEPHTER